MLDYASHSATVFWKLLFAVVIPPAGNIEKRK
jgi:hypothetical protein